MKWQWIPALLILMSFGCSKQQYAQCGAADSDLKIMFKPKVKAHPFSHSFCIVCNTEIEPSEYADWAVEMGAPNGPGADELEYKHPCLYVYTGQQKNVDDMEECKALVCDGTATYSDMVGKQNGNFDLGPLLENNALTAEEWVPANGYDQMMSIPTDNTTSVYPEPVLEQ